MHSVAHHACLTLVSQQALKKAVAGFPSCWIAYVKQLSSERPFVAILEVVSVSDKIGVIENFCLKKAVDAATRGRSQRMTEKQK